MAKLSRPDACRRCPLDPVAEGFSLPEGTGSSGVMIAAEALGEAEVKDGLPLRPYAPAGSVFERALRRAGIDRQSLLLWNTVACRPPSNLLEGTAYEQGAIESCRVHFDGVVARFKPRVILC